MTDPYIQINGTKIEVFDNDLSAVRTIKQLSNASKIIIATRDMAAASGDISYTGLDFTPTSIICFAVVDGTFKFSAGMADSAKTVQAMGLTAASTMTAGINIVLFTDGVTHAQTAILKTYDENVGFTLTWTKAGTPTGTITIYFLCFR